MNLLRKIGSLFYDTAVRWSQDKGQLMAAALAYYMVFAIAPLLVISINIVQLILGDLAVTGQLFEILENVVGVEAAAFIQLLVENATLAPAGTVATIVGILVLLYGASNVFYHLKLALNFIWRVDLVPDNGLVHWLKTRFLSLAMVLTLGFLFAIAFAMSFALTTIGGTLAEHLPEVARLSSLYQLIIAFVLLPLLLTLLFKILPDAHIAWRDVWLGAFVTAVLLMSGVYVLSIVVSRFFIGSIYGAAGSLVVILFFVYYSAQILFFGAEFTQVYSNKHGRQITPSENAVVLVRERRDNEVEPIYAMPVYTDLPRDTIGQDSHMRRFELRAALGLALTAVVLLIAFVLGRKSS